MWASAVVGDNMSTTALTETVVEDVGDAAGQLLRVPVVLIQNFALIALLGMVGYTLISAREVLIVSSPFIAEHAVLFAAAFNAIISPLYNSVVIVIDVIKAIQLVIRKLLHRSSHTHFTKLKFLPLSVEEVRRFFSDLPARCVEYMNVGHCLSKATKAQTNHILCPLVRYTYPVPWMWRTTNFLFGWGISNAVPQGTFVEDGTQGNCELDADPPDWLCVSLSVGYLIVDILLPILLVAILWPYTISPFLKLAYRVAKAGIKWISLRLRQIL